MFTPTRVDPELHQWLLSKTAWPLEAFAGVDEQWRRESVEAFAKSIEGSDLLFYRDAISGQHYQLERMDACGALVASSVPAGSSVFIVEIDRDEVHSLLRLIDEANRIDRQDEAATTLVDLLMNHYRREVASGAPRQAILNYRRVIESFSRWLGRPATVVDLTATNVSSFTEHLLMEPRISRASFQMHRVQINQLSAYAQRKGWLRSS